MQPDSRYSNCCGFEWADMAGVRHSCTSRPDHANLHHRCPCGARAQTAESLAGKPAGLYDVGNRETRSQGHPGALR